MAKKEYKELEILLEKAFSDLSFKENLTITFYALFLTRKRDKFLDFLCEGYTGKCAYKKIHKKECNKRENIYKDEE